MLKMISQQKIIPQEFNGARLDTVAAKLFPDYSRACLQRWIKSGMLRVDEQIVKPRTKVFSQQLVRLEAKIEEKLSFVPEPLTLDIIHEDAALLVVNKPAGLVVHPGAGRAKGTLLNGLLYQYPTLALLPRAGIVHRLDKNTTGLMVVAKTLEVQTQLVIQLQQHAVVRRYEAICEGVIISGGSINAPIGRHPTQRTKMAVTRSGKTATTHYRIKERFKQNTYLSIQLETGRTHQIRVHMAHMGYPLVGDIVYGTRSPSGALVPSLTRQALHACQLSFVHPDTGHTIYFEAAPPADFQNLIAELRAWEESAQ